MLPLFARMNGLVAVPVPLDHDVRRSTPMRCSPHVRASSTSARPTIRRAALASTEQRSSALIEDAAGVVILDEAYAEFSRRALDRASSVARTTRSSTRTLSKAFGLAGLRIGYGVGAAPLIRRAGREGARTVQGERRRGACRARRARRRHRLGARERCRSRSWNRARLHRALQRAWDRSRSVRRRTSCFVPVPRRRRSRGAHARSAASPFGRSPRLRGVGDGAAHHGRPVADDGDARSTALRDAVRAMRVTRVRLRRREPPFACSRRSQRAGAPRARSKPIRRSRLDTDVLVLPGVGAFGTAATRSRRAATRCAPRSMRGLPMPRHLPRHAAPLRRAATRAPARGLGVFRRTRDAARRRARPADRLEYASRARTIRCSTPHRCPSPTTRTASCAARTTRPVCARGALTRATAFPRSCVRDARSECSFIRRRARAPAWSSFEPFCSEVRSMIAIPAVDLRDGACVQLVGGSYAHEQVRLDNPLEVARGWARAGFQRLHVVDLDAATGPRIQRRHRSRHSWRGAARTCRSAAAFAAATRVERLLGEGAQRVVRRHARARGARLARRLPHRASRPADRRRGRARATRRRRAAGRARSDDVLDVVEELNAFPSPACSSPRCTARVSWRAPISSSWKTSRSSRASRCIASGGIATLGDLRALADAGSRRAVIGMALYTGALDARAVAEEFASRIGARTMTHSPTKHRETTDPRRARAGHGRGSHRYHGSISRSHARDARALRGARSLAHRRRGDLQHHLIEDVAIALGTALAQSSRARRALRRSRHPDGRRARARRARPRRPAVLSRSAAQRSVRPLVALVQRQRPGDAPRARAARRATAITSWRRRSRRSALALRDALRRTRGGRVQHQGRGRPRGRRDADATRHRLSGREGRPGGEGRRSS